MLDSDEVVPCLKAVQQMVWNFVRTSWDQLKSLHPEAVAEIVTRHPKLTTRLLLSSTQPFELESIV